MDYATLKLIWWALVLFMMVGFIVMDGFDLGIAMLLPVVSKDDDDRRLVINSVGPVWEGNQVWLIAGAGALFADDDVAAVNGRTAQHPARGGERERLDGILLITVERHARLHIAGGVDLCGGAGITAGVGVDQFQQAFLAVFAEFGGLGRDDAGQSQ